jgi:peptidoglycan/xylan/chitin deacetylase (PgdA/CDA1 family)
MFNCNLILLSYHRFTAEDNEYPFSRTYKQFRSDIETKDFDWITIDDGHKSQIKACKMMQDKNIRAKLFTTVSLVGTTGYCSWDDLWKLSKFHDISNHATDHVKLTELATEDIYKSLEHANMEIKKMIGVVPRFFVPPYNTFDYRVEIIAKELGLVLVKDRINITNNSR